MIDNKGKISILHIIYDDINNPWLGGGGSRRTFEIYRRFPKQCSVVVLTAYYKGAARTEQIENIRYKRLGVAFSYLISRITFALSVPWYLLRLPYDVVVDDFTAFSPCFSFFFSRKPVIGSFQNLHSQKAAKGKGLIKAIGVDIFDTIALRHFRNITAVSPNLTSIIQQRAKYKQNIRFIGVGVEESFYEIDRTAASDPYILYLGRIELYQKGIDMLLQAYALLAQRPKLMLAGSGIDVKKVKEMILDLGLKSEVKLIGRYTNTEESTLLTNAIFVVMPSRFEGFPLVPLEAMASGRAFIGTKIPGTSDIVGDCAVLVENGNVEELAAAMRRLLTDEDFRISLEQKGRERSRQFSWASISRQFYDFIVHSMA